MYTVKVEKTQKFLDFHKTKNIEEKPVGTIDASKLNPLISPVLPEHFADVDRKICNTPKAKTPSVAELQQGDIKTFKNKPTSKKKSPLNMKFMESMPLDEFAKAEEVDKSLLNSALVVNSAPVVNKPPRSPTTPSVRSQMERKERMDPIKQLIDPKGDLLDPVVLIDGRPAKHGATLDKQITLFYKMECGICHENGFHFRSLMKHYKERHGVPGYVSCCDKKFHYFYPKKIIEHMAYHLQPNIFM